MRARWRVAACTLLCATALQASETINYTYDARGRLVQAARSGTVNNGVTAAYGYDKADNRTSVVVTGAGPPLPAFSISDASVSEGGTLSFNVTKSGTASGTLTVNFATSNGTATAGSDFTGNSGTLSFTVAETSKPVNVATLQDSLYEGDESLTVTLSGASSGSTIADGVGAGTITDDDSPPAPSFAINDVSVTEGGTLSFTVTKAGTTASSFSVNYATANVTAIAGSDYTSTSGTLTFAAADTTKTVSVSTTDDASVESVETLNVNLSGPTGGATITDAQGVGTINDNDTAATCNGISFAIGDAADTEGNGLTFAVTKSGSASISCSISYATANGTAAAPSDYTSTSGTLTFATNETTKYVSVTTLINGPAEGDETMYVNLSSPTGGSTISDSQGVGTLYNWVDEGGGGGPGGGCPIVCR